MPSFCAGCCRRRSQLKYFRQQEAEGKIIAKPPSPTKAQQTQTQRVEQPEFLRTIADDPELSTGAMLSRSQWISNPGWIPRDGVRQASSFKKDFTWDMEELEYMKAQGMLDKKHNRRRDEASKYAEAAVIMKHSIRGAVPGGPK